MSVFGFVLVCLEFRGYKGIRARAEGIKEGSDVNVKKKSRETVKLCKLK